MSDVNPNQSPANAQSSTSSPPPIDYHAWRVLFVFVSLFLGVGLFSLFADRELTAIRVAGLFALPLLALGLIWRGKMAGYWILVALFGMGGLGGLAYFIHCLYQIGPRWVYALGIERLPATTVCLAGATWLVLFPSLRLFIRSRNRSRTARRDGRPSSSGLRQALPDCKTDHHSAVHDEGASHE